MDHDEELIRRIYDRFNARDTDAVLAVLADDVEWANGMDGTHVRGPGAVRDYWAGQWSVIDPRVDPGRIDRAADGSMVVEVHQTVRDLEGRLLIDESVRHAFRLEGGRVRRFDILTDTQLASVRKPA